MQKVIFAISKTMVAFVLFVGMCGQLQLAKKASASESAWFKPENPGVEKFPDRTPVLRSDYNTDCTPETGVIRPAGLLPQQTIEGCAVRGSGGRFLSGYFKADPTHLYASLGEAARPIPGSPHVLRYFGGTSQVSNVYLIPGFSRLLKPMPLGDGKLRYDLKPYQPIYLKDRNGGLLNIDHNSVSFSMNGEWLIASSFQGMVRFNLNTHELLLFDQPLNYQSGIGPLVQSAITNDGRYAIIASGSHSRLRLYDLSNCPTINSPTIERRNCQYRDLYGLLPAITEQASFQEVRFLSDHAFRFYRRTNSGTSDQYVIFAAGTKPPVFNYLALGDSYTSGEGAYQYRFGTDTSTNICRVSERSYPYLIKQRLGLPQTESVACAGARVNDIFNSDPNYKGQVKDGISFKNRDLSVIQKAFLPGYLPQKSFVEHLSPGIVTISVGGNDIGFGDKLLSCVGAGTCFSSYEDRLEVVNEINSQYERIFDAYLSVKSSSPGSKIYALGYPEIAKTEGSCGNNVWLNNDEIKFSNLVINELNKMLERAAYKAGVDYIDVSKAFYGHRMCETVYSNIAVNGLTSGRDKIDWKLFKGPVSGGSYHPNALGHRLYEQAILKSTDGFKPSLPLSDQTLPDPVNSLLLADVPHSGRPLHRLQNSVYLSNDVLIRGQTATLDISNADFPPESLSASSAKIGELALERATSGSTTFNIPVSLSPGFWMLTFDAKNIAGEEIRLYKTVYVAESEDDLDGDSFQNTVDGCLIVPSIDPGVSCDGQSDQPLLQGSLNIQPFPTTSVLGIQPTTRGSGRYPTASSTSQVAHQSPAPAVNSSRKVLGTKTPKQATHKKHTNHLLFLVLLILVIYSICKLEKRRRTRQVRRL